MYQCIYHSCPPAATVIWEENFLLQRAPGTQRWPLPRGAPCLLLSFFTLMCFIFPEFNVLNFWVQFIIKTVPESYWTRLTNENIYFWMKLSFILLELLNFFFFFFSRNLVTLTISGVIDCHFFQFYFTYFHLLPTHAQFYSDTKWRRGTTTKWGWGSRKLKNCREGKEKLIHTYTNQKNLFS